MSAVIRSMTGAAWGRAAGADAGPAIAVEIRSVNGKGLVVKHRLPAELAGCDRAIEERVRAKLHRGTVVVHVGIDRGDVAPSVDTERFGAVAAQLVELAQRSGLAAPTVADVLAVPGVVTGGHASGADPADGPTYDAPPHLLALVDDVLERLIASRETEGASTADAIRTQVDELDRGVAAIAVRAPQVVDDHRARLIERVNEFLDGRALRIEPADVVRELGMFADRVDVSEELQRLTTHLERAREMLTAGGQVGRPLEFLGQELLREVNTIGSKSPDVEIAHVVVAMKSAVDRLKEQAANLE